MRKIIALILATLMIAAMAMSAIVYAADGGSGSGTVTITVNRDSSYAGSGSGREFTWYKIFSATYASSVSDNATGHTSGVANVKDGSGTTGISYTATAAVAAKLGSVDSSGTWNTNSANKWFDLTPIAGSDDFNVSWRDGVATTAANLQEAAKWLVSVGAYEKSGTMTASDGKWTADVEKGYYVLSSDTGDNVIAATTDITVNEKNEYPPIDKKQSDEDNSGTTTDEKKVAVGDVLNYEVTVTVPSSAKVDANNPDTIEVYDKITKGLKFNNDLAITLDGTSVTLPDGTSFTGSDIAWDKLITVTAENKGKTYTFKYSMTVTKDALVDTGRINEAGLKYGDEYDAIPKTVPFTTYFTGVHKVDGASSGTKMEGVKFTLKEAGVEFKVSKTDEGYYIPDASGSSEVITNVDGYIYIRGLDDDKTYTLTETETLPGYNMLDEDVTLVLVEDTSGAYASYNADSYQDVINNQGSVLPSTGGIGTTIFYIVGGLLAVGAGVVLVTKKRMGKEDV